MCVFGETIMISMNAAYYQQFASIMIKTIVRHVAVR